ncbi:MAG: cytochrome oxidase assembly factor transrane protein [Hyphomicrobiales bacterium]|jgi:protein SCO1/2|nr:cytochrome oxidase assembly factor transrane protein [Hyphomicrobiales bacterium]
MIVPLVCLVLGVFMLAATAFFTLRDNSVATPTVSIGGAYALIDQDGKALTPRELQGRPYLVFFGYTHCPDVCPTTLMEISQVFESLGPAAKVAALFVTVDPERDTPAVLKDYLSSFDQRIMGATGPRESVDAALKSFRVYARRVPGESEAYTMDHSAVVYLMDKQGRFVSGFNLQQSPQQAAQSLKPYL